MMNGFPGGGGCSQFGGMGGSGLIGGVLALLFGVALIGGLAVLAFYVVRALANGRAAQPAATAVAPGSPEEVARLRYARGEISREQYQQMLSDMGKLPPTTAG